MKKFICNKFAKTLTVPKITKNDDSNSDKNSKRSSGFYDLQEAQLQFDQTRSLPTSIYVDSDSEEEEDQFLDAKSTNDVRRSASENEDVYVDVEQTNIDKNNSQYEYDVPRISFKFFQKAKQEENIYANEVSIQSEPVLVKHKKSELRIVLQSYDGPTTLSTTDSFQSPTLPTDPSESFNSQSELTLSRSLETIPLPMMKSGSDPNLRHFDEDDDSFYKVPRSLTAQKRLSQSLADFNAEIQLQISKSNHSSIEHISCSQVQVNREASPDSLDYCKTRSRLPILIRRATLLKKPRKAMDSWNNFKNKMSLMISEQAAQQRVGAFNDKSINLEDMYKNSKNKCKKMATKFFSKKKSDSSEPASLSNSVVNSPKLTSGDIEYKMTFSENCDNECSPVSKVSESSDKSEFDFTTIRSTFKKKLLYIPEGQNGFEDLRRYVKQGGDFCKELAAILQERAEAETQYAKSLSKLSAKLSRACRDGVGGVNDAWKAVALELEAKAEAHRIAGASMLEETAKPLRNLNESQHRTRKQCENQVEKSARLLGDWRAAEAKGKKHSHTCARDNEKLQDAAVIDTSKFGKQTLSKSTSLIHLAQRQNSVDKENAKLEGKKKKAEDAVKKADIEYYTLCVRAERARLEWESAVLRGVNTFQSLEEERLSNLKLLLVSYLRLNTETQPKIIEATERLKAPIEIAEPTKDLIAFQNLRQSSQQVSEQLLPDFYCEHITLAMNRERRKQALVKLLHLIRQDIERERKSKNGLENLSKAIRQTPNFGTEDSQQSVVEKLYHMKSMLTYLEGARYKVQSALAELDSRPRAGHPLAPHITVTRDKSGLQQSVLKVPQWLREELLDSDKSPVSEKSTKSDKSDNSDPHINDVDDHVELHDWTHRGTADGNSNQPDSDFDEFSSQCSSNDHVAETENVHPIAKCKAIYMYTPNLPDELSLSPGDIVKVYRQQDDGWWLGESNGNVGIFPATYVEIVP